MSKQETIKDITDLEGLAFDLSCAVANLGLIHTTLTEGATEDTPFSKALYSCFVVIDGYCRELEQAIAQAFRNAREEEQ